MGVPFLYGRTEAIKESKPATGGYPFEVRAADGTVLAFSPSEESAWNLARIIAPGATVHRKERRKRT